MREITLDQFNVNLFLNQLEREQWLIEVWSTLGGKP